VATHKIFGLRGVRLLPPTLLLGVVVEITPGMSVAGMSAVLGGVDVERVIATTVAVVLDVLDSLRLRGVFPQHPIVWRNLLIL
jgi:hypothetical protein